MGDPIQWLGRDLGYKTTLQRARRVAHAHALARRGEGQQYEIDRNSIGINLFAYCSWAKRTFLHVSILGEYNMTIAPGPN